MDGHQMAIETLGLIGFALLTTALVRKTYELRSHRKSAGAALDRFHRLECMKFASACWIKHSFGHWTSRHARRLAANRTTPAWGKVGAWSLRGHTTPGTGGISGCRRTDSSRTRSFQPK